MRGAFLYGQASSCSGQLNPDTQLSRFSASLLAVSLHRPVRETGEWLRKVVMGHMNYYAVPQNLQAVGMFILEVKRAWLKALRRRSQRKRMQWERFKGSSQKTENKAR